MFTYEIFLLEEGSFGYTLAFDGGVFMRQVFAPGVSGFIPMTESEARAYAEAQVAELSAPPPDEVPQ